MEPPPVPQAAQPVGAASQQQRPHSPHGMSKIKSSTRKLAAKLGIGKKDRREGAEHGGSGSSSPREPLGPPSPALRPAGVTATSRAPILPAAPLTPVLVPPAPAHPLTAASPLEAGASFKLSPLGAAGSPLAGGVAYLSSPQATAVPHRPSEAESPLASEAHSPSRRDQQAAAELESAKERLARLRSAAERASHSALQGSPRSTSPRPASPRLPGAVAPPLREQPWEQGLGGSSGVGTMEPEVPRVVQTPIGEHHVHAGQAVASILGVPERSSVAGVPEDASYGLRSECGPLAQALAHLPPGAVHAAPHAVRALPAMGDEEAPAHLAPRRAMAEQLRAAAAVAGGARALAEGERAQAGEERAQAPAAPRRVTVEPYHPAGEPGTPPPTPASPTARLPASIPARLATGGTTREVQAAERTESEAVAPFRPASADTPRGRLATAVAWTHPYAHPAGTPGFSAAEEEAGPSKGPWEAAAEQPVVAVGGTTCSTHVGREAELLAARMHGSGRAVGSEEGAGAGAGALGEGPSPRHAPEASQLPPAGAAMLDRKPVSVEDVSQGQSLAAADVAAGRHAATDAAAGGAFTAPPAGEGREVDLGGTGTSLPKQQEGQQEEYLMQQPARPAEYAQHAEQGAERVEEGVYFRVPPHQEEGSEKAVLPGQGGSSGDAGAQTARSGPLLPAGAFSQAQDISVFSPKHPAAFAQIDGQADEALKVLPAGPAATVGPLRGAKLELAPYAAGAAPEKLDAGPFGAQVDISVFSSAIAPEFSSAGPRPPIAMDRRTESEAVEVEGLAERLQADAPLTYLEIAPGAAAWPGMKKQEGYGKAAFEQKEEEAEDREREGTAEAPVTATVTAAAQGAADKAAEAGTAAKQAAGGAASRVAEGAAGAVAAARVMAERVFGAGTAGTAAEQAGEVAGGAADKGAGAAVEVAGTEPGTAGAAKEAAGQAAGASVDKADAAKGAVADTAGQAADTATGMAGTATETAGQAASTAADRAVIETAGQAADTAAGTLGSAKEVAGQAATAVADTAAAAVGAVAGPTAGVAQAAKEMAGQAVGAAADKAAAAKEAVAETAGQAASSAGASSAAAGDEAAEQLTGTLADKAASIKDVMSERAERAGEEIADTSGKDEEEAGAAAEKAASVKYLMLERAEQAADAATGSTTMGGAEDAAQPSDAPADKAASIKDVMSERAEHAGQDTAEAAAEGGAEAAGQAAGGAATTVAGTAGGMATAAKEAIVSAVNTVAEAKKAAIVAVAGTAEAAGERASAAGQAVVDTAGAAVTATGEAAAGAVEKAEGAAAIVGAEASREALESEEVQTEAEGGTGPAGKEEEEGPITAAVVESGEAKEQAAAVEAGEEGATSPAGEGVLAAFVRSSAEGQPASQEKEQEGVAGQDSREASTTAAAAGSSTAEEGAAEAAQEAPSSGSGLAGSLLGAAFHAVAAVSESLHSVLEHGRQLAAEQDSGDSEIAAGGGSTVALSEAGQEGQQDLEEEGGQAAASREVGEEDEGAVVTEAAAEEAGQRGQRGLAPLVAAVVAGQQPQGKRFVGLPEELPAELGGAGNGTGKASVVSVASGGMTAAEEGALAAASKDIEQGALGIAAVEEEGDVPKRRSLADDLAEGGQVSVVPLPERQAEEWAAAAAAIEDVQLGALGMAAVKGRQVPEGRPLVAAQCESGGMLESGAEAEQPGADKVVRSTAQHGPAAGGAEAAVILPVAPRGPQLTMQEAVEQDSAVSPSLLQALEGAQEPSTPSTVPTAAPHPTISQPGASTITPARAVRATGESSVVLPVAVSEADKQTEREAAMSSVAVDASLAVEEEAPQVAAAELAEEAQRAQPEGLDATSSFLAQREAAREKVGLGLGVKERAGEGRKMGEEGEEVGEEEMGAEAKSGPRLAFKDISGLREEASKQRSPVATPAPAPAPRSALPMAAAGLGAAVGAVAAGAQAPSEGGGSEMFADAPTEPAVPLDEPRALGIDAGLEEATGPGCEEATEGAAQEQPKPVPEPRPLRELKTQGSEGGLREPPPSPTTTSPTFRRRGVPEGTALPFPSRAGPATGAGAAGGAGLKGMESASTSGRPSFDKTMSRLQTSTTAESSTAEAVGEIKEMVLPVAITPAARVRHVFKALFTWATLNPVLAAGLAALLPVLFIVLTRLATAVLGEFGPALVTTGTIAAVLSAIAWVARFMAVPESELEMIAEETAAAGPSSALGGSAAAATAAAGTTAAPADTPTVGEVEALPGGGGVGPSEPVTAESTEDLMVGSGSGGLLQAVQHTVEGAVEGVMEAVEPGREMVGEVIQETEDGGDVIEDEESDDPLARAMKAVSGVAASAKNKLSGLAGGAYRALGMEAPGADISGQGAPIKDLAEGAKETAALQEEEVELRRRVPAPPDALRPAPPPAGGDGSGGPSTEGESGYESDNDNPGPVLEGVHPAPHRRHSAKAHVPSGVEEPTIAGEACPGLLTRAAEATGELAVSAADKVKYAAAVVTGTAEEQRLPVDRLAELQASITEMEVERAEDVEFQKASKRLGM